MKIGLVKFGKSTVFDDSKWGNIGGNGELPMLIHALAHAYPQHEFWLIGANDLKSTRQKLPDNVFNAWSGGPKALSTTEHKRIGTDPDVDLKAREWQNKIIDRLDREGVELDAVIAYCGIVSTNNMVFMRRKQDGTGFAKPQQVGLLYCSPPIYYLQHTDVPWINIITDPRQMVNVKDWAQNKPRAEISQLDKQIRYNPGPYVVGHDKVEEQQWFRELEYAPVEKLGLMSMRQSRKTPMDKESGLTIVMHEGGGQNCDGRGPMLKEYVLDQVEDVEIFGRWEEPWISDPRFKGPVPFSEVAQKLDRRRYTFCIPISSGWSTFKAYEMIANGVIPFLHPSYALEVDGGTDLPEFLYVESAADLQAKMKKLDENPKLLEAAWQKCLRCIKPEWFSGVAAAEMIRDILDARCGIDLGEPDKLEGHILDRVEAQETSGSSLDQWF